MIFHGHIVEIFSPRGKIAGIFMKIRGSHWRHDGLVNFRAYLNFDLILSQAAQGDPFLKFKNPHHHMVVFVKQ